MNNLPVVTNALRSFKFLTEQHHGGLVVLKLMKNLNYGHNVQLRTQNTDAMDSHFSKHTANLKFLNNYHSNTVLTTWVKTLTNSVRKGH